MCTYRKWVLTLGIMAVTPGIATAGPFSLFKRKPTDTSAAKRERGASRLSNQQVAERIAAALRAAKFDRHDIEIEVQRGVATLNGAVADGGQKTRISQIVGSVAGVERVNNRLAVNSVSPRSFAAGQQPRISPGFGNSPIQQAGVQNSGFPSGVQQASLEDSAPFFNGADSAEINQKTAERIAKALSSAGLSGYDIEIQYQDGVARLAGSVSGPQQWQQATQVVSQVSGVRAVDNRMTIEGQPVPQGPMVSQAAFQGGPMGPGGGMPAPPAYGHGGQGAAHTVYNMPHLPEYAWPAMATYPNSAQISYPQEYSASAWPYIGPFYPYPQVPLGWRKAQLEWDDGQWVLKFQPRTDKWFWFLNPSNW